ncbi:hypothetical protein DSM112329_02969 [Paraconexibacter sp. AEG42_29]|uniref:Uncharacterized protein n=1 Tax=Paraconexibacter sp. AEG42_29 TaxID=2997339 RepID=A0AAU7AWN4_9ACTN
MEVLRSVCARLAVVAGSVAVRDRGSVVTVTGTLNNWPVVAVRHGHRIWGDPVLLRLARDLAQERPGEYLAPHPLLPQSLPGLHADVPFVVTVVDFFDPGSWAVRKTVILPPVRLLVEALRKRFRRRTGRQMTTITGELRGHPVCAVLVEDRVWGDHVLLVESRGDAAGIKARAAMIGDPGWASEILSTPSGRGLWRQWQIEHVLDRATYETAVTAWLPPIAVLAPALADAATFWPDWWWTLVRERIRSCRRSPPA